MGTTSFMYSKLLCGFLPVVESSHGKNSFSFLAEGKKSMTHIGNTGKNFLSSGTDKQPRI